MKRIVKFLLPLVLVFVITLGISQFLSLSNVFGAEERITNQGVVDKIKDVAELNTVEIYFSEIIDYKSALTIKKLNIPFTQKSFVFTVKARVKAGVDLSKINESDVVIDKEAESLTLMLLSPTITSKEILSHKAYSEKDGLFNEVKTEDTLKALETFQTDLEQQAIDYGILDKAKENAEKALVNIFKATGFESVRINWR